MLEVFCGSNLRGQSFNGKNLASENFSHADIRGAKFARANLRGANFSHARAGLQNRWVIFWVTVSFFLAILSGLTSSLVGYITTNLFSPENINRYNVFPGVVVLILLSFILFILILKGFTAALGSIAIAVIWTVVGSLALIVVKDIDVRAFLQITTHLVIAVAEIVVVIVAIVASVALSETVVGFKAVVASGIVAVATTVVWSMVMVFLKGSPVGAFPVALVIVLLGSYTGCKSCTGDETFAWLHQVAVYLTALCGTSFCEADITDTNFTQATLKNTNFRGAIITRTRWYEAKKLDQARVGDSILSKPFVRDLLVTGKGNKKYYEGANIQGANLAGLNLKEANLKEADISKSTLNRANLEGANLTQANAVGADFTNAYLTGACLESWNIDSTTKLDKVDCRYVYLLENPNPITGDRERRPHDYDKVFEPGDFEKLYKKIMNTVQILLRHGVNKEAFTIAFQKLMEDNPEITTDSIQSLEKKGNDFLLTLEVPEGTDKGKVQRNFEEIYEAKLEAQKQAALLESESRHSREMKEVTMTLASNFTNLLSNLTIIASGENTTMTKNNPNIKAGAGSFINLGEGNSMAITGSNFLSEISGNVTHAVNQLPAAPESDKPGIKELLTQLQAAIEAETNLSEEDKAEALEQVKALAEAGKNPQEGAMQKAAKTAMKILKGTVTGLPGAAALVEACNKLLPAIASLLNLA